MTTSGPDETTSACQPHGASLFPASDADGERELPRPFGAYTLLKALGRGGMGTVFLARRAGLAGAETLCVVKCLRAAHEADEEYVGRFLDEARTAVRLDHRNICRVFDVSHVGDTQYLAMELVPGRDLGTLLQRAFEQRVPLSPAVALGIVAEVLDALDYAHRLGDPVTLEPLHVVHRDISPQNVMVTFDGEVKLIDFRLAQSRMKLQQTRAGVVMGKLAYMSPEQARAERVDGRCDQYAAAVMAYELLLRERFYGAMSTREIWSVVGRGYRPPGLARMPAELRDILARALDPDVERRFPSCEAFREALLGYVARTGRLASADELARVMDDCFPNERLADERERLALARVPGAAAATVLPELDASQRTETMTAVAPPVVDDDEGSATVLVAPAPSDVSARRSPLWLVAAALGLTAAALAITWLLSQKAG